MEARFPVLRLSYLLGDEQEYSRYAFSVVCVLTPHPSDYAEGRKSSTRPAWWLIWLDPGPVQRKVVGSNPSQGT